LLLAHLCSTESSLAQQFASVRGKVIDAKTNEPLVAATVYLARTSIGTYTQEGGTFVLDKIPQGKYDLTISMLGYTSQTKPMLFNDNTVEGLVIQLVPTVSVLDSVSVTAKKIKQHQTDYLEFEKHFLGQTRNSNGCKILNRNDLIVYKENHKLMAEAINPLVIQNNALGYLIHYDLKEFVVDYDLKSLTLSGVPRFEEMTAANAKQKKRWLAERDRAYFGSIEHFLKSLTEKKLAENYFEVKSGNGASVSADEVIKNNKITYKGSINISFSWERPEDPPFKQVVYQLSQIVLDSQPITVYENGYFEDFHHIRFEGYFAWSDKVAEQLPLGFKPSQNLPARK
jgi:hypothetical protein